MSGSIVAVLFYCVTGAVSRAVCILLSTRDVVRKHMAHEYLPFSVTAANFKRFHPGLSCVIHLLLLILLCTYCSPVKPPDVVLTYCMQEHNPLLGESVSDSYDIFQRA